VPDSSLRFASQSPQETTLSTTLATQRQSSNGTSHIPAPAPAAAKIADPGPLGLAAFAITTFLLSMVNAGFVDEGVRPIVFGMALFMGGLAQLLAGMWEYRTGNTFGATAFTAYGAFWLSFWAFVQFYADAIPQGEMGHAVGLYLLAWGGFTAYMTIASFRVSRAVNVVFLLLTPTFFLLGVGDYAGLGDVVKLGGVLGLVTAAAAAYASAAGVTNATFGRTVLPTRPLS
jgi:succinate-acetate transporter protein